MSHLIVKDLEKSKELDHKAMALTKGGMFDMGPMAVVNAPVFAPVTVITEVSPTINIDLDIANMVNAASSGISQ